MKITVLGGDGRNLKLIDLLSMDGHEIRAYGFKEDKLNKDYLKGNLQSALEGSEIVIGPIPCIKEDKYLNTPYFSNKIEIEDIFKNMDRDQIFIGGAIPKSVGELGKKYNIKTIDLMGREEMAVLNAIPTAEGAIEVAMKEMDITLYGSNAMVLGFGKVGKVLSNTLKNIGANTYVGARKYADLAWIDAYGYRAVDLKALDNYLLLMDVIFNTIPNMILNEEKLSKISKNCLIVDLASKPGGVDFDTAEEVGIKVIWALGLPGKVAPKTAASVIKSTIYNIIEELEE